MKNTLVVVTSNRNVDKLTVRCLDQLTARGAGRLDLDDVGDVTYARNLALTRALAVVMQPGSRFDCLLLVDDDMLFTADQAQKLVSWVRDNDKPASAAYVLSNGVMAATHYLRDRWLTGAGFLCLQRVHLEKMAIESRRGRPRRGETKEWLFEFCTSGFREHEGDLVWEPEDSSLTRKLGGVVLLPISVGHIKRNVMEPPEGEPLEQFITDIIAAHPPECACPKCAPTRPRFSVPPVASAAVNQEK